MQVANTLDGQTVARAHSSILAWLLGSLLSTACLLCDLQSSAAQGFAPTNPATPLPPTPVALRDICRLKGQEENTLHGLGLVVGLKGTGDDSNKLTSRTLASFILNQGGNIGSSGQGIPLLEEVEDAKNVALVAVTAKLPTAGVQQGDLIDCHVNAYSAKSLVGGRLMVAYMMGPRADQPTVYAIAEGRINVPDRETPTTGFIRSGCKMEATIRNEFVTDGIVTLILDSDLASFSNAAFVQDQIDSLNQGGSPEGGNASESYIDVRAIDQHHIEVTVPSAYKDKHVQFVSLLMDVPLTNIKRKKRVVINEREGVIIIGEDVMINPVAISHRNLSIEAKGTINGFVGVDPQDAQAQRPRLKNLVEALNGLNVPTQDMINIIRTLHAQGAIYAELTFL